MIKFIKKHLFGFRFFTALVCLILSLIFEKTFPDFEKQISLPIAIFGYLIISYDLYIEAIKNFINKEFFSEETLTIIASIASIFIGEWVDGLAVVIFFQLGEFFEDFAMDNSRKSIESILSLKPSLVHSQNGEDMKPEDINIGDIIIVKPGEIVPIDGEIIKGKSSINTSQISGESMPVFVKEKDKILSGVINLDSPLLIKVSRIYENSTVARILNIIENSNDKKTTSEKFITRFAKIYTPIVIALALSISILPPLFLGVFNNTWNTWSEWIYRGASMLVIACPCALVISIPMSFVVSIGVASKNKIIIKGTTYLELLNKADSIYLDKTGTITVGDFSIDNISPEEGINPEELLKLARIAEAYSNHPIAKAILKNSKSYTNLATEYKEIFGKGISCNYKGKQLIIGNDKMFDDPIVKTKNNMTGTSLFIFYDNKFFGTILLKDTIKENSRKAISEFNKNGIKNISILTGDNKFIAKEVADNLSVNNYKYGLLPIDKTKILEDAKAIGKTTIFVGDGVNDAPSLIISSIGISMGQIGSESAIEASDIVILDDDLNKINYLKQLAKINRFVVYWNIIFSITIKVAALVLNAFGILEKYAIAVAIFADVGVTILCCINSLLISFKKK